LNLEQLKAKRERSEEKKKRLKSTLNEISIKFIRFYNFNNNLIWGHEHIEIWRKQQQLIFFCRTLSWFQLISTLLELPFRVRGIFFARPTIVRFTRDFYFFSGILVLIFFFGSLVHVWMTRACLIWNYYRYVAILNFGRCVQIACTHQYFCFSRYFDHSDEPNYTFNGLICVSIYFFFSKSSKFEVYFFFMKIKLYLSIIVLFIIVIIFFLDFLPLNYLLGWKYM
jgi:hypothetical protein